MTTNTTAQPTMKDTQKMRVKFSYPKVVEVTLNIDYPTFEDLNEAAKTSGSSQPVFDPALPSDAIGEKAVGRDRAMWFYVYNHIRHLRDGGMSEEDLESALEALEFECQGSREEFVLSFDDLKDFEYTLA